MASQLHFRFTINGTCVTKGLNNLLLFMELLDDIESSITKEELVVANLICRMVANLFEVNKQLTLSGVL